MSTTYTASHTSTFTEARARAVMRDVLGDFMNVASAGLIARETIQQWHEEVEYAVRHQVVDTFELQFTKPGCASRALSYEVRDDGTILEASKAGGVDLHDVPPGSRVSLYLAYRQGAQNLEKVQAYLRSRGWTTGGGLVDGARNRDRSFSKDGFGVARIKVGDWE